MGTVTQYNLANVQAALGGANPISMSEYYRGGAYVPTTRTVTVSEGPIWSNNVYDWVWMRNNSGYIRWSGALDFGYVGNITTYTRGSTTYYRGAFVYTESFYDYGWNHWDHYQISRTYPSTTAINTGVPSSGAISISQLYGAANP